MASRGESPGTSGLHILHLIDSLHHGGTELHVLKLSSALARRGVRVSLLSIGRDGPLRLEYERLGLAVNFETLGSFKSWRLAGRLHALRTRIDESGANVVHAHDIYSNLAGALVAGRPRSWRFFASQRWGTPTGAGWKLASRFSFGRADLVTANGPGTAAIAVSLAPGAARRIVSMPNFLEDECFDRAQRDALRRAFVPDASDETRVIGYVGRLDRQKRVDWLLDATRAARDAGVDARLVAVGAGEERAALTDAAERLGIAPFVTFTGLLPRLPLPHAAFDLLALASETEGVPNCLVEGMAAGTPVIATAVGGVPNLLANGAYGTLVDADDARAFRDRCVETLRNLEAGKEAARRAVAHARSTWHENVVVMQLLARYLARGVDLR